MVAQQLATDSTGRQVLWDLIKDLSKSSEGIGQSAGIGFEFGVKALIVLLVLLVLAIIFLAGAIIFIFLRWERGQAAGIKAMAASKDSTKREVLALLKDELGNARNANAADITRIEKILTRLANSVNTIVLDLAIVGTKLKIPMRSSPTEVTKEPPKEGG